ncbi:bifunctional diaminohydroxyphosphoribosylaminopyrimidine deaminase/5-amino-6-(5-phosphoribosylamino)uracil reductase RibD [Chitinophaga pendula]|uniref:bifunctional diaminohydroxyphosphoribosylaminopyrimidine deaminase/5-amino-6-(5-phosphoribosylamino)uracil reductase RibD n=1 Tax=Chitinophaga TaxID=79328 RepID=UPI000BAF833A|nr:MULTISPECIES: bifunctional diaminohydroxyphosphoribosylaminopyrimidine deaminase/5-amino-6-(5-phosphoribosylamino)uracil reductase RibD [Chitinophaga]ASZ14275.1 riboflavin biosynthesis protein RibD [Chitinophaga sp. MD30]UCJ08080.1 bifunctional diaminohydroxyphosphoribosylaminopyrimidine deaminase/5-amino-6-(5-phosphoribosylamino)uracil reductase RibD [Chitinophaga pendula]
MDHITDEIFMRRCITLAKLGAGHAAPNPMVGAVLVHEGRIIGEGYHRQYGQAHAEVNCVHSVTPEDRLLIPLSTMYVSLEPCAHFGKTPPCADLIVHERIPQVVIGCVDTFSKVAGKGIEKMTAAGIQVRTGILEQECRELNRRFFTYHEAQRPYVILKWAQDPNGFIAGPDKQPVKISNTWSNRLVHRWRSEEASILVGTGTALADNPMLNNRLWTGKDPLRLVIDRSLKVPPTHHVWDDSIPTLFITEQVPPDTYTQTSGIRLDFGQPILPALLQQLYERQVLSVLVEGGAYVLQRFLEAGLWDEARVITGQQYVGPGTAAPVLPGYIPQREEWLEGDNIRYYRRK